MLDTTRTIDEKVNRDQQDRATTRTDMGPICDVYTALIEARKKTSALRDSSRSCSGHASGRNARTDQQKFFFYRSVDFDPAGGGGTEKTGPPKYEGGASL